MPIYEYKCPKCKKAVEKLVRLNQPDTLECVDCKVLMEKVLTAASFKFKVPPT